MKATTTAKTSMTAKAAAAAVPPMPTEPDLRSAPPPKLGDLPWGYGDNRICVMARDPHWAVAYWEITDDALAEARRKINDPNAACHLRVYDTTNKDFDGLNANDHWDLWFDRSTIVHTIRLGRPGNTFHVDVGVRGAWGAFAPIARSNSLELPRDSVTSDGRVEWSTVLRGGQGPIYRHRHVPAPWSPPPSAPPGPAPQGPTGQPDLDNVFRNLVGEGWSRSEWTETRVDGRVARWIRWSGPYVAERFSVAPAGAWTRVEVLFQGERRVVKVDGGERFVFGPWRVLLEAVGEGGVRRTISQWMVRHEWTTEEGSARVETPAILTRILGGERATIERTGSEERLSREAWGSELVQLGASEWRWRGASETIYGGSSETLQLGASETLFLGGTEIVGLGASELRWGGASEAWAIGGSDARLGGSEGIVGGSSEERP